MSRFSIPTAFIALTILLAGCGDGFPELPPPPWELGDDDDDDDGDDDDAVDLGVMLSGSVVATARETGQVLTDWAYLVCAGKTVLYVSLDADDLSDPVAKFTMDTPGAWEMYVQRDTGPYWLVAVTDDGNRIVGTEDVRRSYALNPVLAAEDTDGIDLVIDLPCTVDGYGTGAPGAWGGNGGPDGGGGGGEGGGGGGAGMGNEGNPEDPENITVFSGQIILNDLGNSDIMITANNEDGSVGPIEWKFLEGAGPYTLAVANTRPQTMLIAYHDTDGNGLFEASDAIGEPTSNPFLLGIGNVPGANIEIPSGTGSLPQPPVYVGVQGTVSMDDFPGGSIRVFASAGNPQGTAFSTATLSTPGAFALAAPIDAGAVMVWAVLDAENDGFWDLNVDPYDNYGPFNVPSSGIGGIGLDLSGDLPNNLSGTIYYEGEVSASDVLFVGLYPDSTYSGAPVYSQRYNEPTFPLAWSITGVVDGSWYPAAHLDVGGDSREGPSPEDLYAIFGSPVTVNGGQSSGGIDLIFLP